MTIRLGEEGAWVHCHAVRSHRDRLRGIAAVPAGVGVLFAGRSAHGFGLAAPLDVVAVDRAGRVVGMRRLAPRRILVFEAASHLVEIPVGVVSVAVGPGAKVLCAAPVVCPYARDALRVRNADREPR